MLEKEGGRNDLQKKYPEEFMEQAIQSCLAKDVNRKEIADNIGINYKIL